MRIGIDARVASGLSGGVEMVIIGLAQGFAALTDGDEEYLFYVDPRNCGWLKPYLGRNCHLLPNRPIKPARRGFARFKYKAHRPLDYLARRRMARRLGVPKGIPASNGRIEAAGVEVMHFTLQSAFATPVPSLYHPHDLQHLHMPEFFEPDQIARRELRYPYFCNRAKIVPVASSWMKGDVTSAYGLDADKVQVVPFAPPNMGYRDPGAEEMAAAVRDLGLPEAFAFYPAQTWAHKNHIRLLRAAAALRDRGGPTVNFVFSGHRNEHFAEIEKVVGELGMEGAVRFLGFVSPGQLQCLYKLARFVVVPSLHEAGSFPVWEAFLSGTPVAASNVTSLPRQVGDAGLIFDPHSEDEIGGALERLWQDADLRRDLARRGRESVARFTWERTARHFRAMYRQIAGQVLSDADRALLADPPML